MVRKQIIAAEEDKQKQGAHYIWNEKVFRLEKISYGKELVMEFSPSDYFTSLAHRVIDPSKLGKITDWSTPAKDIYASLGINLSLITSDGYTLITRRSAKVSFAPGHYSISVNEAPNESDWDPKTLIIDLYKGAVRGGMEENGTRVNGQDVNYLSLGVDRNTCQWGILGSVNLKINRREFAINLKQASDAWESDCSNFIEWNPRSVLAKFKEYHPWTNAGRCELYHCLVHAFSQEEVDKELVQQEISKSSFMEF